MAANPRRSVCHIALLLGLMAFSTAATASEVVLLTLEWPPYTGVALPDGGLTTHIVKAAYAEAGIDVNIGFFSWRRAIHLPYDDHRFAGFFPEYPGPERQGICDFSDPIGSSPVGMAERKASPLKWNNTDDLKKYRIGVVSGYVNEDHFDAMVARKEVQVVVADNDTGNLINLLEGKVDGAIIDNNVFDWLARSEPRLKQAHPLLQMNARQLANYPLVVCFRKGPDGAVMRDQFNAALRKLTNSHPDNKAPGHP